MLTPAQDAIVLEAACEIIARHPTPYAADWADELSFAVTAIELGGQWVTQWTRDLVNLAQCIVLTAQVRV